MPKLFYKMSKQFFIFLATVVLLFDVAIEPALARAGGRSSFGGGRSSTSYYNQGSRGSRTFEGGGANGKNYAPMQRSTAPNANKNSGSQAQNNPAANQNNPGRASSFFGRHPILSTLGAALAGSWLGHMIFGAGGFGAAGGSGFLINFLLMALGAFAVISLVKFLTRGSSSVSSKTFAAANNVQAGSTPAANITLPESEKNKFVATLVAVQTAWSEQNIDALKKMVTSEMAKYFSDALAQNISQGIANKVENIEITSVEIAEAWREDEMEYATVIVEWSAFDYMINLNKSLQDFDYIVEGGNKNLTIVSEAWTFTRHNSNGNWILSAIAQVE